MLSLDDKIAALEDEIECYTSEYQVATGKEKKGLRSLIELRSVILKKLMTKQSAGTEYFSLVVEFSFVFRHTIQGSSSARH